MKHPVFWYLAMLLKLVFKFFTAPVRSGLLALTLLFLGPFSQAGVVTNLTYTNLIVALTNGGPVTFLTDGTLTLSNTIQITTNTVINGAGRNVTISGGGISGTNISTNGVRLFFVTNNATLTLLNITLAHGRSTNGAGIYNAGGSVTISNCVLASNFAFGKLPINGGDGGSGDDGDNAGRGWPGIGGGIYNHSGTISIVRSTVFANLAAGSDGGQGGDGGNDSAFGGNGGDGGPAGFGHGGGIYNLGTLFVTNSTFQLNLAAGGDGGLAGIGGTAPYPGRPGVGGIGSAGFGGGIYNLGTLVVNNTCFVSNNVAGGNTARAGFGENDTDEDNGLPGGNAYGGGIYNRGTSSITNSTFTENTSRGGQGGDVFFGNFRFAGDGGSARGGAIYNSNNVVNLVNCTIATNNAFGGEPGLSPSSDPKNSGVPGAQQGGNVYRQAGQVRMRNSILAKGTNGSNYGGTVIDDGYNLTSDTTPVFSSPTSMEKTNARLGSLSNHGGFTPTMALLRSSPAIDKGDPSFCLPFDQRGVVRPQGVRCDIGAYEREPAFDISGRITDGTNGVTNVIIFAIANVVTNTVTNGITNSITNSVTNATLSVTNGFYSITELVPGTYNVSAGPSYSPNSVTVEIASNDKTNINFSFIGVAISGATFSSQTNGLFRFMVTAKPNQPFMVQTSTNLSNWFNYLLVTNTENGRAIIGGSNSFSLPYVFFRIVIP